MVKNLQYLKILQICYLRQAEHHAKKKRTSLHVLEMIHFFFNDPLIMVLLIMPQDQKRGVDESANLTRNQVSDDLMTLIFTSDHCFIMEFMSFLKAQFDEELSLFNQDEQAAYVSIGNGCDKLWESCPELNSTNVYF